MTATELPHDRITRPIAAGSHAERAGRILGSLADSDLPVLLVGERGAGKRTAARMLHMQSRRSRQALRETSCVELDEQTVRSFTGLNGTVYLSEVCELRPELQEVLVEQLLAGPAAMKCRFLFGSRRELFEDVRDFRMAESFYYLIAPITLRIVPLRVRKQEILALADEILTYYALQFGRPKPSLNSEAVKFLLTHTWPENIRELETAMKTFVAIGNPAISLAALRAATAAVRLNGEFEPRSLKQAARSASIEVERRMISEVLGSNGGNRKRAAHDLGVSYKTLLYKIKQTGLNRSYAAGSIGATT